MSHNPNSKIDGLIDDKLVNIDSVSGEFGTPSATYSASGVGSFVNVGANLEDDGTSYGNVQNILGPNLSTSATIEAATGTSPELMIDGDTGTEYRPITSGISVVSEVIDLEGIYDVAYASISFRTIQSTSGVSVTKIELSTDNSNFTTYWSGSESTVSTAHVTRNFNLSNTSGQRYARITVNAAHPTNSKMRIAEVTLHENDFATTQNTLDTAFITPGLTVAPAATVVYDENSVAITGANKVNVQYTTDNGSTWSTPEDLATFLGRTQSIISPGVFNLRLQPVGDQRILGVDIGTPSTKATANSTGLAVENNSVEVIKLSTDGSVQAQSYLDGNGDPLYQERMDYLENLIAINTLRDSVDAGWTVLDMISGISDEYSDETGVSSSTFLYSEAGDYYANFSTPEFPPNLVVRQSLTLDDTGVHTLSTSGDTSLTTGVTDPWGGSEQLITFDGTGDFLSVANNAQLDLGANEDKTIEFWMFKNNGTDSVIPLHHAQFNSSGYQDMSYMVYVPNTNQILLYTSADGTNISILLQSSTGAIIQQTWHHVAIVVSGSNISLYLDGTQIGTTTKPAIHTSTSDLMIGHRGNSGSHLNMNGYMTDIVITPQAKYTSNFTVPSTPQETNQPATPSTLTSSTFLASAVPGRARAVMLHEPVQATDLANDLLLEVSRDGGTTYTAMPLENDGDFDSEIDILTSGSMDISDQPSGSDMTYRITTANNKQQRIHGTWLQWD